MTLRQIRIDVDDHGDPVSWSVTATDDDGQVTWMTCKPFLKPEERDAVAVLAEALELEYAGHLSYDAPFESWEAPQQPLYAVTPMPDRR